ncbi:MAG: hypothetical protein JJ866_08035 [Roseibium sp.]|uniref:ubiquinone biosynthesis methyltransferase UbiE n=1 Tax=Roseibium sp. TaxID=1936156 RepID=UPI001B294A04|nr:ubiquinone biosynthesis methyltransferase UbiE [Roseibium sp.]MBO6891873.1 hypothetical protein [Roseibium sp.]MBO6928304.1 hypothetical protein [Roseibium sp.]
MTSLSEGASPNSDALPMLQMDLDIQDFCSDWSHCDLMSGYLARMVSHNRLDSLLFSNLYSSALNELLETVFRTHGVNGTLHCAVQRIDNRDRIELVFPVDDATYSIYHEAIETLGREDAETQYLEALFADREPDPNLGLLELGVDYGAKLAIERRENGTMRLVADLRLEDKTE